MQTQQAVYLALTITLIVGLWWVRDRSACVAAIIVLGGLLAMQAGWSLQNKHIAALTIWSVCAALILISTKPSILTLFFALLIPLAYIPAIFGLPWLNWYRASDIAGICLLFSLAGSGIATLVGGASDSRGFFHSGDLRKGFVRALHSVGMAQAEKRYTTLEDL